MNELMMAVGGGVHLSLLDPEPGYVWQDDALCAQVDSDLFFPDKGGSVKDAKRICAVCPVRAECLADALARDERFGIWGGVSERERRRLKGRALQSA